MVVCKGYDNDYDYYTGLYWNEDKDLEIKCFEDYQIWLSIKINFKLQISNFK